MLFDCVLRRPLQFESYPCGADNDCYYDAYAPSSKMCKPQCPSDPLHSGDAIEGKCITIDCRMRRPDPTQFYVCHSRDCFADPLKVSIKQCIPFCGADILHTGFHTQNGTCLITPCEEREAARGLTFYPCHSNDCFYDDAAPLREQCKSTCPTEDLLHTGEVVLGECVMKPCSERTVPVANAKMLYPCGMSDCFLNPVQTTEAGTLQCVSQCIADTHLDGGKSVGVCTLKPCGERTATIPALYPCGSNNCWYNPDYSETSEVGTECTASCGNLSAGTDGVCGSDDGVGTKGGNKQKLEGGAIAGIVAGSVAVAAAVVVGAGVAVYVNQHKTPSSGTNVLYEAKTEGMSEMEENSECKGENGSEGEAETEGNSEVNFSADPENMGGGEGTDEVN